MQSPSSLKFFQSGAVVAHYRNLLWNRRTTARLPARPDDVLLFYKWECGHGNSKSTR